MGRSFRTFALLAALAGSALGLQPSHAAPATLGPDYPGPSSFSFAAAGNPGQAGGLTWTYTNFDQTTYSSLWWGPWDANAIGLAFDNAINSPAETMSVDAARTDLANGVLAFAGSAQIFNAFTNTTQTIPTRFTFRVTDVNSAPIALIDPASAGAPTVGGVSPVTGDYKVNALFEALSGSWQPAQAFFDAYPKTSAQDKFMKRELNAGFFWVPPPSSLSALPLLVSSTGPSVTAQLSARLVATKTGAPIAGHTVTFTTNVPGAGTTLVCSGTTDASGVAACSAPDQVLTAAAGQGYDASFAGGNDYLPSSTHASLAG